jgi:perosamine synthetase
MGAGAPTRVRRSEPAAHLPISVPICAPSAGEAEEQLLLEVLRSGRFANGPKVELFEDACADMAGTEHAIAVANGTASLELLLEGLGIGLGDEVITTSFTFAATVSAIVRSGATARLVDVGPDFTIDVDAVEAAIGPRTAAVLPVHLYGHPADLVRLEQICARSGLALIEDAAQAHGARVGDRAVGGWGHGSFSFYATKNVSCGEGGVVTTDDGDLARRLRLLRNQGMEHRYQHEVIGRNLRMSELHAALGLPAMGRLSEINEIRRMNASALASGLSGIDRLSLPSQRAGTTHVWHQFTVLADDRTEQARRLMDLGVQTGIHYPMLVNEYKAFRARPDVVADPCPRARRVSRQCLSLPVHDRLTGRQLEHIVESTLHVLAAGS